MPVSQCRAAPPHATNLVLGVSPPEFPDARLGSAVCRTGAAENLDLGNSPAAAKRASTQLASPGDDRVGIAIWRALDRNPADPPRWRSWSRQG
jgi:hypothetical protein